MPEKKTSQVLSIPDVAALCKLLRQDSHRLNNLILIVQGNVDLLFLENSKDNDNFQDIMQALKECRDITGRLLYAAGRFSPES